MADLQGLDAVAAAFRKLSFSRKHRYMILKLDDDYKNVEIVKCSERDATFE